MGDFQEDLSLQEDCVEAMAGDAIEMMHRLLPRPIHAQQPSMQHMTSSANAAMSALIRLHTEDPVQVAIADAIQYLLLQQERLGLSGIPLPHMGILRVNTADQIQEAIATAIRQLLLQRGVNPSTIPLPNMGSHRPNTAGLGLSSIPLPDMGALRLNTADPIQLEVAEARRQLLLQIERFSLSGIPLLDMGAQRPNNADTIQEALPAAIQQIQLLDMYALLKTRFEFSQPAEGALTSPQSFAEEAPVERTDASERQDSTNSHTGEEQPLIFALSDYMLGDDRNDPFWRLRLFSSFASGWGATVAMLAIPLAAKGKVPCYAVATILPTMIAAFTLLASFYIPPSRQAVNLLFLVLSGVAAALIVVSFVFPPVSTS